MSSMNSKERIRTIINLETPDRPGFWLGHPAAETVPIYTSHFGVPDIDDVHRLLGSDLKWLPAERYSDAYRHPQGRKSLFPVEKHAHGDAGPFANCEDPGDIDFYEWPDPDHVDIDLIVEHLKNEDQSLYIAGGFWTPFYHNMMGLFGMEEYLVKMYECPEVVLAVTDRVCEFYYEVNRRLFEKGSEYIDGFFFGNDFGTQLDVICGPDQFDQFIMPWFRKFTNLGHEFGLQVILHSCGSIHRVIDRLIEAGVDCLHPLQARANNMDADTLARDFKGRIAFMGGIDTQKLLVHGTPEEVRADVERVKSLLSPHLIVSPSHEALLPNVPPENVQAMAKAAIG